MRAISNIEKLLVSCLFLTTTVEAGFPVSELALTAADFQRLNTTCTTPGAACDGAATSSVLPLLRDFFLKAEAEIEVEKGDIVISGPLPDETVDSSCGEGLETHSGTGTGDVLPGSFLKGNITLDWKELKVVVEAKLNSELDVNLQVTAKTGVKVFGHCHKLAQKTVGLDVSSSGQTGVAITLTASHAAIKKVKGTWSLVFDVGASVVGTVLSWHCDTVHADKCKIKVLGIQILSVCGFIDRTVQSKANSLISKVETVVAPKLIQKFSQKLQAAIGSQVVIPLKWPTDDEPSKGGEHTIVV